MGWSQSSVPLVSPAQHPARAGTRRGAAGANPGLIALAVKLAKSAKFLLLLASLVAYSVLLSWQAAVVLVFGLCCHEYGHVWAMRRRGIPTKGFYLIPFVGGVCAPSRPFGSRSEEAFIASMGPVFGLATTPLCFALAYLAIGRLPAAARITEIIVFVNLFNLLPIVPMDGGRMLRSCVSSFSRMAGLALVGLGIAAAVFIGLTSHAWILVWVAVLAVFEIRAERRRGREIAPLPAWQALGWIGAYVGIMAVGVVLMSAYGSLGSGPSLTQLLRGF